MNWKPLESIDQLEIITKASFEKPQIIFKHSTQCNISADALNEMNQADWEGWYLDLLAYRAISNKIAEAFGVTHKSPQVIVLKNGQSVYDESHWRIKVPTLMENL